MENEFKGSLWNSEFPNHNHKPNKERKKRVSKEYDVINKSYWTITEVSEILGENKSALRFWEDRLPWVIVKKGKKGNRAYTRDNLNLIEKVFLLTRWLGITEAGIKQAYKLGYFERLTEFARQEKEISIENEM